MKTRILIFLFCLLPATSTFAQNITVGEHSYIRKERTSHTRNNTFEGFAMNTGFGFGYGRSMRPESMNYVPFAFDLSVGLHASSWLSTNVGAAVEAEWGPKEKMVHLAVPVFAELQFNIADDIEDSPYITLRAGNAFRWDNIQEKQHDFEMVNLYLSLRLGYFTELMDIRLLEYTFEGCPWIDGSRNMHMITCGIGFHL